MFLKSDFSLVEASAACLTLYWQMQTYHFDAFFLIVIMTIYSISYHLPLFSNSLCFPSFSGRRGLSDIAALINFFYEKNQPLRLISFL
jgi:hypothetical protein